MKPYLVLAILLIPFCALAQSDTIFYNRLWEKTTRDSAVYYRLTKQDGKLLLVKDCYMSSHRVQMVGHINNLEQEYKEGWFVFYDSIGHIEQQGTYVNSKKEGRWIDNYSYTDTLWAITHYNNDASEGIDSFFFKDGSIKRLETYRNNEFVTGKCFDKNGKEIPYYPYQVMPEFQEVEGVQAYLAKHIKYPKSAIKANISGRVILRFVINEDGSISEVQVVKSVSADIDKEAIRVVKEMPKWKPGKLDNAPARVWFTQPITFRLED